MAKEQRSQGQDLVPALTQWFFNPDRDEFRGAKGFAFRFFRAAALVSLNFLEHKCLVRASALSFTTILSLVPLFAFAFAVLKGLGVQNTLEPLILEHLTAGSGEVASRIITYINNTKMASLGAIGLVALVITIISLLGSIEETFNDIWGVQENRSPYRRFSDYLSVVVCGPLLLLAAMSITTSLQSQSLVRWLLSTAYFGDLLLFIFHVIPYLSVWLALVCLYIFLPNTRVKIGSALVGGILAGTAWQAAQWGYIHFQIGVAKYNAVYGTLSALPVFMVWIYTSWLIVLVGVEVVAFHQNRKSLRLYAGQGELSYAAREMTGLVILLTVGSSFHRGERPWTLARIADERHIPLGAARKLLSQLVKSGYLVVADGVNGYVPARDLEHVSIGSLLGDLKREGGAYRVRETDPVEKMVAELLARLEARAEEALEGLTLKDLVLRLAEGEVPPQAPASPSIPR
jgi:membrane protein